MRRGVLIVVGLGRVASAQPPSATPVDEAAQCRARRAEMMRDAQSRSSAAERQKILLALPECPAPPAPPPAPPPPLPPGAQTSVSPDSRRPPRARSGVTFDAAIGLGIALPRGGAPTLLPGVAGPNLGLGFFVVDRIAVGVRLAGVTAWEEGFGYLGLVGASAQAWFDDHIWGSLAIGPGVVLGCDCDKASISVNARVGYALTTNESGAFLALDLTTFEDASAVSVLVGYQTF